jgi:hypothetical protein
MTDQLSIFDPGPDAVANVAMTSTSSHSTRPSGVERILQPKPGPFLELQNGQPTGREYQLIQLIDGRFFWQFTDNGERRKAPNGYSTIFIDDAIRYGTLVEVSA